MPVPMAVMSAWISLFERTLSIRFFSTLMILPRSGSTACVLRSRPCLAEPRAAHRAVGELAGKRRVLERGLAPREVARLARSLAGPRRLHGLGDDLPRVLRVLLEEVAEPA